MLNLVLFLYSLQVAVVAHTITLLMEEGHIFHFWSRFLNRKQWSWPSWKLKMLGDCERCFCGQIGFWSAFLFLGLCPVEFDLDFYMITFSSTKLFQLITFTAMVIFTTEIFRKWLTN